MLKEMRSFAASIWGKVFLAIVAFTFIAFFGGAGRELLKTNFMDKTLMSVGPRKITVSDFIKKLRYTYGSKFSLKQLQQFGFLPFLIQSEIRDNLLDIEAEKMGIISSDDAVRLRMADLYTDKDGNFREDALNHAIASSGMSHKDFVKIVASNLRKEQLLRSVNVGYKPSDVFTVPYYKWQNEKREVLVYTFDSSDASYKKGADASEEEINNYYNDKAEKFRVPEFRSFEILIYDAKNINDKAAAMASEKKNLLSEYNERKDTEFKGKSFEEVRNIIRDDLISRYKDEIIKNISDDLDDMAAGGKTFAQIAEELPVVVKRFEPVNKQGMNEKGNLVIDRKDKKQIDAFVKVFDLDAGESSEVMITDDGSLMMVKTSEIIESKIPPLKAVKDKIVKIIKDKKSKEAAMKAASELLDKIQSNGIPKGKKFQKVVVRRDGRGFISRFKVGPDSVELINSLSKSDKDGKKKADLLSSSDSRKYYVVVLSNIIKTNKSISKDELSRYSSELEKMLSSDAMRYYLASLRSKYKVDVSQKVLDQLINSI